jgi:hypothetical protein
MAKKLDRRCASMHVLAATLADYLRSGELPAVLLAGQEPEAIPVLKDVEGPTAEGSGRRSGRSARPGLGSSRRPVGPAVEAVPGRALPVAPDEEALLPLPELPRAYQPHRGPLVLTLGISSLACGLVSSFGLCCTFFLALNLVGLPLGVTAWVMGQTDLKKMQAQSMDAGGMSATKGGWVCGIVGTFLNIVALLCIMGAVVFGLAYGLTK